MKSNGLEGTEDEKSLKEWRNHPVVHDGGDFADVVYAVMEERITNEPVLTVHQVNVKLDELAACSGEKLIQILQWLFAQLTAFEIKWIVRIILKAAINKFGTSYVLKAYHPDADDLYHKRNKLRFVCDTLDVPHANTDSLSIELFVPFQPMMSWRSLKKQPMDVIIKDKKGAVFWIQEKFDGERVQIHKRGNTFRYWSRRGHETTEMYGDGPAKGSFTPELSKLTKSGAYEFILDGEMVEYDPVTESIIPFGTLRAIFKDNSRRKHKYKTQLMYCVFDIILLNGKELLNYPLKQRHGVLDKILHQKAGLLMIVPFKEASTKDELATALEAAIERREEGIIIKNPTSTYHCGARSKHWIKLKPEYMNDLCKDLDVIVVGGYRGDGIAGGFLESFLVAVIEKEQMDPSDYAQVYSFCRVKNGLTYNELEHLYHSKKGHWHDFDPNSPPEWLKLPLKNKDKPHVWIHPYNSFVLTVQASSLMYSTDFPTKIALRFPRVTNTRHDKTWNECLTFKQVTEMFKSTAGIVTKRGAPKLDLNLHKRKRENLTRGYSVLASQRGGTMTQISQQDDLFDGKHFYVIKASPEYSKELIEQVIIEHGGTFSQTHTTHPNTIMIAGASSAQVESTARSDKYDILRPSWIFESITNGYLVPMLSRHYFYRKGGDYPQYEKSTTTVPIPSIQSPPPLPTIKQESVDSDATVEDELDYASTTTTEEAEELFSTTIVYFDDCTTLNDPSTLKPTSNLTTAKLLYQLKQGTISPNLNSTVTHVILDPTDTSRLSTIQSIISQFPHPSYTINPFWITDCINQNSHLRENAYLIKCIY